MRQSGHVNLIGTSPAIAELKAEIERIARSDAKVLITGESGVGKDIVARAICAASPRADAAFIPVNCAGIPETLLESELFGHVKGSFTGAYRDKPGKLEMANGGTIFLDEIGEMTLRMQGLFLRFLETGELQKVGAERIATAANVRVIAATNRNLQEQITQGQFREDLFYRLNVIHLVVPPLRDRREDIPLLIDHFLKNFTAKANGSPNGLVSAPLHGNGGNGNGNGSSLSHGQVNGHGAHVAGISPEAIEVLTQYSWPGNVRQLENVIERLVVTARRDLIGADDLPMEVRTTSQIGQRPKRDRRRTVADDLFKKLLEERESFWTAVYPLYMDREITRGNVRDLIHKGLEEARGNYKIVLRMFNMDARDYKRFLNFLRKHDCQLPFKEYRQ
jgi:transcriptional regulator with PAS, ATPase and Fis domain